jgi:hypothetical protein
VRICTFRLEIISTSSDRHHATDVIAGGILGLLVAWLCYRVCVTSLSEARLLSPVAALLPTINGQGMPRALQNAFNAIYDRRGLKCRQRFRNAADVQSGRYLESKPRHSTSSIRLGLTWDSRTFQLLLTRCILSTPKEGERVLYGRTTH